MRSGKIKAYRRHGQDPLAGAPDVPTLDEAGVPGLYISFWHGLWVPKGTPKDVIAKLNAAVVDALADPAVRQRLADLGQEIPPREQQTPEALGAFHKAEIEKWWPIIKAASIKVEAHQLEAEDIVAQRALPVAGLRPHRVASARGARRWRRRRRPPGLSRQAWPQRTVKFLLPLGPGSGVDIGARLCHRLSAVEQPVVVENRPGRRHCRDQRIRERPRDHLLLATPTSSFTAIPTCMKTCPTSPAIFCRLPECPTRSSRSRRQRL